MRHATTCSACGPATNVAVLADALFRPCQVDGGLVVRGTTLDRVWAVDVDRHGGRSTPTQALVERALDADERGRDRGAAEALSTCTAYWAERLVAVHGGGPVGLVVALPDADRATHALAGELARAAATRLASRWEPDALAVDRTGLVVRRQQPMPPTVLLVDTVLRSGAALDAAAAAVRGAGAAAVLGIVAVRA